jgi:hypothetical protein
MELLHHIPSLAIVVDKYKALAFFESRGIKVYINNHWRRLVF